MKNSTQLFAKANEQKQAGKTDIARFVLSWSSKALNDLIENTWAMEGVENCNGVWLRMAEQMLRNNKLHPFVLAEALRTLIIKGRGKRRNVMVIGPANCGKTFLFRPMEKLFKVFCNPGED